MTGSSLMDRFSQIDWKAAFQWYWNHMDAVRLIQSWQQGQPFTLNDWLSFILIWAHAFVISALVYAFVRTRQNFRFREWLSHRRSQLTHRPAKEERTQMEPKLTGALKKAYNLHRMAMYEPALDKFKEAVHSSPNDINIYLGGIKIVAEMEDKNEPFVQFLRASFHELQETHPRIWNEVAKYGRQTAPGLDRWQHMV